MTDETSKTKPAGEGAGTTVAAASPTKATQGPRGGRSGGGGAKAGKSTKKPTLAATKATGGKKVRPKATKSANGARKPQTGTKQEKLIAMLRRPEGATVEEIARAFGWQPHTVRGALYGVLRKRLGLDVTSDKVEGRGRVYRIGY